MTKYDQIWAAMIRYDQIQIWPDLTGYDQIWPDMIRTLWLGCFSQLGNWTAPRTRWDINHMVVFCCSCTLQNTYSGRVFLFVGHGFVFIDNKNISLASNEFWNNQVHLHFALVEVWRGGSRLHYSVKIYLLIKPLLTTFLTPYFLLFWKISGYYLVNLKTIWARF